MADKFDKMAREHVIALHGTACPHDIDVDGEGFAMPKKPAWHCEECIEFGTAALAPSAEVKP